MPKFEPINVHLPVHAEVAEIVNRVSAWQREMREIGFDVYVTPSIAQILEEHIANGADYFQGVHLSVEIYTAVSKDGKHE
jgi:hypothetical protein